MGVITVKLDDELEKRFREELSRRGLYKKGMLRKAIEEAVMLWLDSEKDQSIQ